jgi:hypothetical protein
MWQIVSMMPIMSIVPKISLALFPGINTNLTVVIETPADSPVSGAYLAGTSVSAE